MKILEVKNLNIPGIKVIRFARFKDERGYFTEQFRKSDLLKNSGIGSMKDIELVQANQSYSKKGTIRGLHFQWNPYMGKLVRTVSGHMVDIILDIRKGSPTFGKIIMYDMPTSNEKDYEEWIWIPPGFAHGNFFPEDSIIEYFCSGEYSPNCEAGISPFARDIDWSLCDLNLKKIFDEISMTTKLMTDKDRGGFLVEGWKQNEESNNFVYEELKDKIQTGTILFTGGGGLLGREMEKFLPQSYFPSHEEFDITNYNQMKNYLIDKQVKILVHAAAFTSPPLIDQNPLKAIESNIIGTANVAQLCMENNIKLIYLSTDYVFKGEKGNYKEDDSVYPVNKYAWSKLGGECAVKMYDNSLIVRTSFGENEFPFEKAFVDQWTTRESVSNFAKKLIKVIDSDLSGTIHIGGKKKTVLEYAKSLDSSKEIGELFIRDVNFKIPRDTSLDCSKYDLLVGGKR